MSKSLDSTLTSRNHVLQDRRHSKPHTQPLHPVITEEDKKQYYFPLINYEYQSLQADSEIRQKSLFELMDYCELQYENSNTQIQSGSHNKGIKSYIRGYLVFNYLINGFIMHHFNGFDEFIATNETDFIIYLNIFAFYNTDVYFSNGSYSVFASDLRNFMKDYLVTNNILSFNINELFTWLNEYISYLKQKDNGDEVLVHELANGSPPGSVSSSSSSSSSFSFIETYKTPDLHSEEEFKVRYPSVTTNHASTSIAQQERPPIPTQVPPIPINKKDLPPLPPSNTHTQTHMNHLPVSLSLLLTLPHRFSHPLSSPPPIPPPHLTTTTEYPTNSSILPTVQATQSPYPLQEEIQSPTLSPSLSPVSSSPTPRVPIPVTLEESKFLRPKSYGRPKREVPDGYLRPTDYTTAKIHGSNGHAPNLDSRLPQYMPTQIQPFQQQQQQQPPVQVQQQLPPHMQQMAPQQYQAPHYIQQFPHQNNYQQQQHLQPHQIQQPVHYYNNNVPPPPQQQQQPYIVPQNGMYSHIPPHVMQQQDQKKHHKHNILKDYSVCGLRNFGSSCYINSTIQLLFGIYEFKSIFNHGYQKHVKDRNYLKILAKPNSHFKGSVLLSEATSGLLKTFQHNGGVSVSPTKFIRVTSLLKPDFNIPYEQQDAQEFLLFLLDRLHDEMADKKPETFDPDRALEKWKINLTMENKDKYLKWCKSLHEHEGTSPISDLFQGHLQNKLKCDKCGYESISYSAFSILSLPIPSNNNRNEVNLSDCLRYYIQDEVLSGENAWNCPKCNGEVQTLENHPVFETKRSGLFKLGGKKKQQQQEKNQKNMKNSSNAVSTKSVHFVKLPSVLIIQLGLFNLTDKLNTLIRYPLVLKFNNQDHEIVYKLSGMINHFGSLKSGHYTALVNKSNVNEQSRNLDNLKHSFWCLFDDENVRSNLANGHLTPPYDELVSQDVYVLCYERIDV